jgi:hypothetical protein
MNARSAFDAFLNTDPQDAGCAKAMELLHAYAELAITDPDAAKQQYPQIAAHVRSCGPCAEDLEGLLAAIRTDLSQR